MTGASIGAIGDPPQEELQHIRRIRDIQTAQTTIPYLMRRDQLSQREATAAVKTHKVELRRYKQNLLDEIDYEIHRIIATIDPHKWHHRPGSRRTSVSSKKLLAQVGTSVRGIPAHPGTFGHRSFYIDQDGRLYEKSYWRRDEDGTQSGIHRYKLSARLTSELENVLEVLQHA